MKVAWLLFLFIRNSSQFNILRLMLNHMSNQTFDVVLIYLCMILRNHMKIFQIHSVREKRSKSIPFQRQIFNPLTDLWENLGSLTMSPNYLPPYEVLSIEFLTGTITLSFFHQFMILHNTEIFVINFSQKNCLTLSSNFQNILLTRSGNSKKYSNSSYLWDSIIYQKRLP